MTTGSLLSLSLCKTFLYKLFMCIIQGKSSMNPVGLKKKKKKLPVYIYVSMSFVLKLLIDIRYHPSIHCHNQPSLPKCKELLLSCICD